MGKRARGTEEGDPGRAAWPDGGHRPGVSPHPELVLGRALGAPEVGCLLGQGLGGEGVSRLLCGLDLLPRWVTGPGGPDAARAAGSQKARL